MASRRRGATAPAPALAAAAAAAFPLDFILGVRREAERPAFGDLERDEAPRALRRISSGDGSRTRGAV